MFILHHSIWTFSGVSVYGPSITSDDTKKMMAIPGKDAVGLLISFEKSCSLAQKITYDTKGGKYWLHPPSDAFYVQFRQSSGETLGIKLDSICGPIYSGFGPKIITRIEEEVGPATQVEVALTYSNRRTFGSIFFLQG